MSAALVAALKSWRQMGRALISPPFRDNRSYRNCKQLLTRAWIKADCDDSQRMIRIPISPTEEPGKSNYEKLLNLKIINPAPNG